MKKAIAGVMMTLMLSTTTQASFLDIDWSWGKIKKPVLSIATDAGLAIATYFIAKNNVSEYTFDAYKSHFCLAIGGIFVHRAIGQIYTLPKRETRQKIGGHSDSNYGVYSEGTVNLIPQVEIYRDLENMFFSKCKDPNVDIKDLNDIREVYKKAFRNYTAAYLEEFGEKYPKKFKGAYPKASEEQLKDIVDAHDAFMKTLPAWIKAAEAVADASFEAAKAKKEYSQNPTNTEKRKVEQAEKRLVHAKKALEGALKKTNAFREGLNDKTTTLEKMHAVPTGTEKK